MDRKIIIYDFEVFKYDTLFGAKIISSEGLSTWQTWNLEEIIKFYEENTESIWVGHNIANYDNFILQGVVKGLTSPQIRSLNDSIIRGNRRIYLDIKLHYYDLISNHFCALKSIEAYMGKNISESEVDFTLDRPLTEEEKRLTESYNRDDLEQTLDDFIALKGEFLLRLDVIEEFKLPLSCLNVSGTRLAEEVLHANKIDGIENWVNNPKMYDNLQVKNKDVIDFYMSKRYATGEKIYPTFCGTEHTIAAGGIHGAKNKYHAKSAYYFDVSGYYNLIMILLNLLPRSIPEEYRKVYENMYHHQLELKKTNPAKRATFKTILLSVFGAMNNKWCRFYDPYNGDLVRMSGQMFLVDLLEKMEGKVDVIQSNTDGIIAQPLPGVSDEELLAIIDEWQERTGFVLKLEKITDIHQRDVNCYMYRDDKGEIHTKGEAVKHYGMVDYPFWKDSYNSKEPLIMSTCLVEYYMNGKLPEQTIQEHMNDLRMFQYICKKQSFDWVEYEETDIETGDKRILGMQSINRAFALKSDKVTGMLYKCRSEGKTTRAKISNLPDSVFVYNQSILEEDTIKQLQEKIDFSYYVDRAYERILEFVKLPIVKDIAI